MYNIKEVQEFIVENFMFGDDNGLNEDTSLLDEGIVDSTGVLELVSFLEEQYDLSIEEDEFIPENLDSLKNIDQFIKHKLNNTN
jgi:acyl carrier protein